MQRRRFVGGLASGLVLAPQIGGLSLRAADNVPPTISAPLSGEGIFEYIQRTEGTFQLSLYTAILGAANEFKEGDAIVGVAARDATSRDHARQLLSATRIADIDSHPPHRDELWSFIAPGSTDQLLLENLTIGELKQFLLERDEAAIHAVKSGLSSDVIACVVKLMSREELIAVGSKVFNPLPNSRIGAKGYLGARIQPNSPTDHLDDILFQVLDGFAYAVGDVLLGTNPVSSEPESVAAIERCLQEILVTFGIHQHMPHCVLSHIDVQAEVERRYPKTTELFFQSIAGNDAANKTFDVSIDKLQRHARSRTTGNFGLYFETGQGADFTNGHGHGVDMLIFESRKYGLARKLTEVVRHARIDAGLSGDTWVHVNDVAGFIGPEVFRSREQLVRCCLEDIVMGKLHGLTIGLDVCSTLHMDVSLDDLDWCLEQVAPANPAYLMALPTKIDPMLGYLTTGYQDHVRLRDRFGLRVNDAMWEFFQQLQVIDAAGKPTEHFGDPLWVFLRYQRRRGDQRTDSEIRSEGQRRLHEVQQRGVFIAQSYGQHPSELAPKLKQDIHRIYHDAKRSIWQTWDPSFVASLPERVELETRSVDRADYIQHPTSGERLSDRSLDRVRQLRGEIADAEFVIVVSEGLNALAAMDPGQLMPLVQGLRDELKSAGKRVAEPLLVVHSGRVRAGYRIGEELFRGIDGQRTLLHIIGERPGSGHHTLSVYMTRADGAEWSQPDRVDHNITRVVSGIATTALPPAVAAKECVRIMI